jgi:nitrite reductase/ring-hydroxylating ferredoxin subunit
MRFDPQTGEPLSPPVARFDPQTGQPLAPPPDPPA